MNVRIILSGLWVALMLNNLLGDVLRIFAGDVTPGEIEGKKVGQAVWLGIAAFMLIPIAMLVLSLTLSFPAIRWLSIATAGLLFVFNAVSVHTYPGHYDKFLILVGLAINGLTIWYAWMWKLAV